MNQDEKNAIIVVDDDPSVLESTSRLLSAFGYLVFPDAASPPVPKQV